MSGFSDLLTQTTAPWWVAIVSGLLGLLASSLLTTCAERRRRKHELQDRWTTEILVFATAYIDAVNELFNPDLVYGEYLEPARREKHELDQVLGACVTAGQRLEFVAPSMRPQVRSVFRTTREYYELEIKQENRESETFKAVTKARDEFVSVLNDRLGVQPWEPS